MDVTMPDGTVIQGVPEGTTKAQLQAKYAAHIGDQAPAPQERAAPAPDPTLKQQLSTSIPVRMGRGMMDPVMGGIQAIAHLVNSPSAGFIDERLKKGEELYQGDRKATGQDGLDLARIGGNIASPINYAVPELGPLRALPYVGRIAEGAVTGGLLGGLQPVNSGNDYAGEKAQQVGFGAGGGALLPTIGGAMKGGGKLLKGIVGESTGAGATSLGNAYDAGLKGGDAGKAFTASMRGNVKWGQVVDDAKAALGKLREQRGQEYRSGMVDVSKDATVLDFAPIDQAMTDASKIKAYAGRSGTGPVQDLSPKTADARSEVDAAVAKWKSLDPAEFHTPEGFDALKQQIGGIKDSYQYGTPQWKIANEAYNAVRGTIAKQAPAYDKVMRGYSEASDEISALEKELSLGKKVNPNTALRKLQSVMRDNANTSWGNRAQMADRLSEAGAPNLLPSLAGQALSTPIPRGLAKYADGAALLAAAAHNPLLLLGAGAASPRAMGEVAYGAGKVTRGATALSNLPVIRALPRLKPGALGAGIPSLINPAIYGAQ